MERTYPELRWLFAVPNGGARDAKTGARLKAEGVKRGVCDMLLLSAHGTYHGLAIELKVKGGKLTPEQSDFLNTHHENGYLAGVCYGADDAIDVIERYVKSPKFEVLAAEVSGYIAQKQCRVNMPKNREIKDF